MNRTATRTPVRQLRINRQTRFAVRAGAGIRRALLIATAAAVVAAAPAAVLAVMNPDGPAVELTGCLKSGGSIYAVAVGGAPKNPCASGETEVHIKNGDVTAVFTGTGLEGGAGSGPVSLAIAQPYRLPQGCPNLSIARWNGLVWACSADMDHTYSASTGLSLSNTGAFAIGPSYRVPQTCVPGQYTTWSGATKTWVCTTLPSDAGEVPYSFGPYSVTASGAGKPCLGTPNTPIPSFGNTYTTSAFTVAAGKYRPVLAGDSRWSIYKVGDLTTYSRTYQGAVWIKVLDANGKAVSTWVRNDQTNGMGDGQHADRDFGSFTSTGGKYTIELHVENVGCTSTQMLDMQIELEKVS